MGARGIKRRKPKRELPDFTDHLAPGDERRVFGQFENSLFTPMGQIEREGFLLRQLARSGRGGTRLAVRVAVAGFLIASAISIVVGVVSAVRHS